MLDRPIRWGAIVGGAFAAEILLIVAAFAWVAFYSYVINPGHTVETYRAYADVAAPWVAIVVGMPVFYAIGRWWAGSPSTALAMFAVYFTLDATLTVIAIAAGAGQGEALPIGIIATSYATKLAASQIGARRGIAPARLAA